MQTHNPAQCQPLFENLEYKDLVGMMKPTLHVDEFASKMGDDADIIVLSFFVRSKSAARDLVDWFEKGYDFVLDADQSPGEISPGRFLVFVEVKRRSSVPQRVEEMLQDLGTLTEFENASEWQLEYGKKSAPFSADTFASWVPLSPKDYRRTKEKDLNEVRCRAGLEVRVIYDNTPEIRQLKSAAGI